MRFLRFLARLIVHCRHENTRGIGLGYALCEDCGGWLPDCMSPRSAENPGGYTLTWPTNKGWFARDREAYAKRVWDKDGPCEAQCIAECDGACAAAHRVYRERY